MRPIAVIGLALLSACGSGQAGVGRDAGADTGTGGGSLWRTVVAPSSSSNLYTAVWLDAPATIYALAQQTSDVIGGGYLYALASSSDDGATWSTVALTAQSDSAILRSVAAVGATDVYAVGSTYDPANPDASTPLVARSTDRGATSTLLRPPLAGSFSGVAADSAGNPIGVGYTNSNGFFFRSTDGGGTWSTVPVPGTAWLSALWTTASGVIYACGMAAPPAGSPDGGADAGGDASAMDLPGVVVRSSDDGATWTTLTTSPAKLRAISGTPDGQRVVAVGTNYTEVESIDGGATWRVDSGTSIYVDTNYSDLGSVWIQDATTEPFIAAGNAPYVIRSVTELDNEPHSEMSETLPPHTGVQQGAIAVAGRSPTDIWAVGAGIFRRQ